MNKLSFNDFGLDSDILESIKKLGYENPSDVQEKVIPLILKNKDIIIILFRTTYFIIVEILRVIY